MTGADSTDDWSYGFSASYPNDKFDAQVAVREIQRNFRPALGFFQRDNARLLRVGASYNPRPRFLNIQQMFHDVYFTRFTNLDNNLVESWDLYIAPLDWHFQSGDSVHAVFDVNPTYERLFETFEISPGVFLLPGEYRFTRFRSNAMSAARRRLSASASVGTGSYWSGHAEQVTASVDVQAAALVQHERLHEPDVRAAARRQFHRAHLHVEHRLHRFAEAIVLQPDSVRQSLEEPGMAEPRPMDAEAGQRFVLCVQPGLGAGRRREPEPALSSAGHQAVSEVPILVQILNA